MADATGEQVAAMLLRALPAEAAELLLGRLDAAAAAPLRAQLADPTPVDPAQLDAALAQFFDLQRIADRPAVDAGEYRPVAAAAEPAGPIDELRALPPDRLARALDGEPPAAVALILSCLDTAAAGQVMKRLPAEMRADVAVRLTRPTARNPALVDRLARAVAAKGRGLEELRPEPTEEGRIAGVAEILRALPRTDRGPVLQRLESAAPDLAAAVRDQLYRMEDLSRLPNRQLQLLLTELEVKKLALALKDVDQGIRDKVIANMSTRARAVLTEEADLLGEVPPSAIKSARSEVMAVVRRLEEEGRLSFEE